MSESESELEEIQSEFSDDVWTMNDGGGTVTLMDKKFSGPEEGETAPKTIDIIQTKGGFDVEPVDTVGKKTGLSKREAIEYIRNTFF